jgi:hypothetical protein
MKLEIREEELEKYKLARGARAVLLLVTWVGWGLCHHVGLLGWGVGSGLPKP